MMTRAEHLEWAKNRALEYACAGNLTDALGSLISDLNKHPETRDNQKLVLSFFGRLVREGATQDELVTFIERLG